MLVDGKVVVVTGGASGIGRALCRRFAAEGAAGVVVADLDESGAAAVARELGGLGVAVDVGDEGGVRALIDLAVEAYGPVDLFCANAGTGAVGGLETGNEDWQRIWDVNVMAHVYAARALVPDMVARGQGYLLHTASAAGLLTNIGALAYTVTKHAVVGLAEWLAVTYGDAGLKVSCLCPQGVRTPMLAMAGPDTSRLLDAGAVEPEDVAEAVVAGLAEERFLILPHPEVAGYIRNKANDYDHWLAGMRKLQRRIRDE